MQSNFSTLPQQWQALAQTATEAEQQVYNAPLYAAMLCRKSMEEWVRWMYENDEDLVLPFDTSLNALLHTEEFKALIAPSFFPSLNIIRKLGNDAVHTGKKINSIEVLHAVKLLHGFVFWVANIYSAERIPKPEFDESFIPSGSASDKNKEQLRSIEANYLQAQEKLQKLEAQLEAIAAIKEGNITEVAPPIDPDEALTREIYINSLLREAGFDPYGPNVAEFAVKGMPSATGNDGDGYVDYVLWGDDGLPLAVVEAKRTLRDPRVGQHQAKLYADCLEATYGQRPLIFYSCGFDSWFWDDLNYPPRTVFGFYTKDELQTLIYRRTQKLPLADRPISSIADRYYQQEAIRAVTEAFEKKRREALLVMATGTGKTRTAAALIDLLSKAGWAKRVLFLADRNALIHQAKVNLNDYLPHLPAIDLTKEKEDESCRIVFSTYQTLINKIDGEFDNENRYYGVGHFDLIIFDEIHRSVYNRYKHIFKYFDGLRVGLTATPKAEGDRDTYALFEMEPNNPTYAYELEQAVADKFLVPPKAVAVPIKFQRKGIKYAELSDEEKLAYEEEFKDETTGEFPDKIDSAALNKWLFNIDTVDKVIGHLMQHGVKVAGGDVLGKTIIFARSHDHAMFIQERFNLQYPEYRGIFLSVIDYQQEYKYDLLNTFKAKEKMPQIALSVDMLDTGIDVPEVVNLVFFKPIRSSAKYWQMIGRGTRLCTDLFAVGEDKTHFVIFDFCENFEFFGQNPQGGNTGGTVISLSERLFKIRLRLSKILEKANNPELLSYSDELKQHLIKQVQALNENSFIVRQHWRQVEKYRDANNWNNISDLDLKELFEHIAPLIKETGQDEMAKRFDALMYDTQLFTHLGDKREATYAQKIIQMAGKLVKKAAIPLVAEKMQVLNTVLQTVYWENATVLGLEKLRIDLRDIIKFLESEARPLVYSNYEDSYDGETKEYTIVQPTEDLEAYRRKVKQYLLQNQHHLVIQKLKANIPITQAELDDIERMLFEQGEIGTKETFVKAYGEQPLGKFIRSIVGLDTNAAKTAFSAMLTEQTFSSAQIRFIDTLINFLSVKGTIDAELLYDSPFTDINMQSINGLFNDTECRRILGILEEVNHNAGVA